MERDEKSRINRRETVSRVLHGVELTALSAIVGLSVLYGVTGGVKSYQLKDYANKQQIETVADRFNVDLDRSIKVMNNYAVLEHNGDEPIYVYIDPSLPEIKQEAIVNALNTTFGLVGAINDKYRYEIVDLETFNKNNIRNKTTIVFDNTDSSSIQPEALGTNRYFPSLMSFLTTKKTLKHFTISSIASPETFENDIDTWSHIYLHEMMHTFGLADLDDKTKGAYSIMNYDCNMQMTHITPGDFRHLCALYLKKCSDPSELNSEYSRLEEMANAYEETYMRNMIENSEFKSTNDYLDADFLLGYEQAGSKITIEVVGDYYTYTLVDQKGETSVVKGKIYRARGAIMLGNCIPETSSVLGCYLWNSSNPNKKCPPQNLVLTMDGNELICSGYDDINCYRNGMSVSNYSLFSFDKTMQ